jgi:hypothetical protein
MIPSSVVTAPLEYPSIFSGDIANWGEISVIPHFLALPGKNDPHIRIPAGFLGPGWGKLSGKNGLDSRAFSGLWARCKSAVFWQTERYNPPVFICIKTGGFKGFPG